MLFVHYSCYEKDFLKRERVRTLGEAKRSVLVFLSHPFTILFIELFLDKIRVTKHQLEYVQTYPISGLGFWKMENNVLCIFEGMKNNNDCYLCSVLVVHFFPPSFR